MEFPIKKVKDGWAADFHVHTKWSLDIPEGPSPEDYLEEAEKNKIHICFLDHYELVYKNNPKMPEGKNWTPIWPFEGDNWHKYLEIMDNLKSNYSFVSSGLEVDYYIDKEDELRNFIDDNKNEFDFLVGTVHDAEFCSPITLSEDLQRLIKKYGSFEKVANIYFDIEEQMVKSKIFKAIAHIDTIYRFCGSFIDRKPEYENNNRIKKIANLCRDNDIWIEYNLSGIRYPIGRPFPNENLITEFRKQGAKIFVGSDSHSVQTFKQFIPEVKRATQTLKNIN